MNLLHILLAIAGRSGTWSKAAVVTPSLSLPPGPGSGLAPAVFSRDGSRIVFSIGDGSGAEVEYVGIVSLNGPSATVEALLTDGSTDGGYGIGGVAISADGNTVAVSDPTYAGGGMNSRGRVSVYRRSELGEWPFVQALDGPQAFSYAGGGGVVLSTDSSILAEASLSSTGGSHQAVRIYTRSPDAYTLVQSIESKGKLCATEDLGFFACRAVSGSCDVYRRGTGFTWALFQQFPGELPAAFSPDGDWFATITAASPYAYRFYRWNGTTFTYSSTLPSLLTGGVATSYPPYATVTRYGEFFHVYESPDSSPKVYRRFGDTWSVDVSVIPGLFDTLPTRKVRLSPWGNYLVWTSGPFVYAYR